MPSLRQLRDAYAPLLLIDSASTQIQVAWLDQSDRWEFSNEESGVGIFQAIGRLDRDVTEARGFIFCDGPGSILGIRTAAMAIRVWNVLKPRPIFAYASLSVVAHGFADRGVRVIADARRETWHHYRIGEGLQRGGAADLSGDLVTPENFRSWSALPPGVRHVPYRLDAILPPIADEDLMRETLAPDAFLHEEPSYVTWTPQVHRAPAK
jgi:tRNA threonylcarbamoyladenosine biosynthesis protein TsaB